MYLFWRPDCFLGLTIIGKTITPTVKRQIGATTINIDSRDMKFYLKINLYVAGFFLKDMRIYIH